MKTKFMLLVLILLCPILCCGSYYNIEQNSNAFITIKMCYNNQSWEWNDNSWGATNIFTYSAEAQKYGRRGSNVDRYNLIYKIYKLGFSLEDAFDYTFYGLRDLVDNICKSIDADMLNANVKFDPHGNTYFAYTNERIGFKVEKEKLYKEILKQLKVSNNIKVNIRPKVICPEITRNELIQRTQLLSRFETDYSSSSDNRKSNIRLALSKVNGLIVQPFTEYSFNAITGRRTEQNGYKEAKIIVNNEYSDALGGGVCQASTTLYNALLLANVSIKESHPHSLVSGYVMLGFDAMVNYGSSDLKWYNDANYPLYIRTYTTNTKVGVEIYGCKNNIQIKRVNEIIEKTELPDIVIQDNTKYIDEINYETYPKIGYKVKSYLEYWKNGELLNKKLIRTQTYKAIQGVKIVGTKERPKVLTDEEFYNLYPSFVEWQTL